MDHTASGEREREAERKYDECYVKVIKHGRLRHWTCDEDTRM
jgi:hypothetical protein